MKKFLILMAAAVVLSACASSEIPQYRGIVVYPSDVYSLGAAEWENRLVEGNLNLLAIHADTVFEPLDSLKKFIESPDGVELLGFCSRNGIDVEYEVHALQALLPRDLFDEHPEYFRMDADGNRARNYNMCFTCDAAYEAIKERMVEICSWLKPTTHRYLFWTDDVNGCFCNCEKCSGYSTSEQALLYENRLLAILREIDPLAQVAHLAYSGTLAAPEKVRPEDGIFLEYAPIGRNYSEPLSDEAKADLEANMAVFNPATAHILEYWLDESMACGWQRQNPRRLDWNYDWCRRDIEYYRSLGANSITTFATWLDAGYRDAFGDAGEFFAGYGKALE